jgi:phage repressor protein C with HTH and peptisase S24 domain
MDATNRINVILERERLRSVAALASKIGFNQSNLNKIYRGNREWNMNLTMAIHEQFPQYNVNWLLTGEGNMLVESIESNAEPLHNERRVGVRLVSQYAYAGYLSGYGDDEYLDSLPLIDFTPDREMTGNWLAFEVRGDSMDDGSKESYIEGEIVICREVEPDYWRDSRLFINKRDFVIVHKEGILIKRIIAHDVDKHTITIHSLNPLYKDRTINLKDVLQIYSIIESRIQRRR